MSVGGPAGAAAMRRRGFANWPLRWKILAPFACLSLLFAASGTYVFSRGTAAEGRASRTARLRDTATAVVERIEDREGDLIALARRIAFTQGMADATARGDRTALRRLVLPVAVNAGSLRVVVTDLRGAGLIEASAEGRARSAAAAGWRAEPLFRSATRIAAAGRDQVAAGLVRRDGAAALAIAAPILLDAGEAAGVVIVAVPLDALIADLRPAPGALTLSDPSGRLLAGARLPEPAPVRAEAEQGRGRIEGRALDLLHVPISVSGRRAATLTVGLPAVSGLSALGRQGWAIAFVGFGALGGVFLIGAWVSRRIARPVRRLVEGTRALHEGDLSHRVTLHQADEIGELAVSFNVMAEELEGSQRDLERRVEERTRELAGALQSLDRTNTDLARANEAKSSFLANVSHELRTPLSGILIASEMLHDPAFGTLSEERVRDLAGKILGSGRHLLALIDDLLDLSRIEAGRLEFRPQPVAVSPLMTEVREAIEPMAGRRGLTLSIPKAAGHRIFADPVRVRQVLFNLLTNAVKFTKRGGRVWVKVGATRENVEISVNDNGIGMARKDLRRIFEPFEQLSPKPDAQGTGLGLAISKRIVELHGGRLSVSSAPGRGSTFTVSLPKAAAGTAPEAPADPGGGRVSLAGKGARVLVVEDDPVTMDLVSDVLVKGGYSVEQATRLPQALARVRDSVPDLVLLDVRLGGDDGLDVVRTMRRRPATREVPVLALSAHGMPQDVDRGTDAGVDAYLVKPVAAKTLLRRVGEMLDARPPGSSKANSNGNGRRRSPAAAGARGGTR